MVAMPTTKKWVAVVVVDVVVWMPVGAKETITSTEMVYVNCAA